jgi:hypothetical protein
MERHLVSNFGGDEAGDNADEDQEHALDHLLVGRTDLFLQVDDVLANVHIPSMLVFESRFIFRIEYIDIKWPFCQPLGLINGAKYIKISCLWGVAKR